MSILVHFGQNCTKMSFLPKIFFRKLSHLFRHPQISLVEVCSVQFWGGRRSTTNDGCSGSWKCNPQKPGEIALHADYLGKSWSLPWDSVLDAPSLPRPSLQSSSAKTVGRTKSRWVFPESSLKSGSETTLIFLIWSIFGLWRPKSLFLLQNRYVLVPKRGILRWLPACPAHNMTAATQPTLLIVT